MAKKYCHDSPKVSTLDFRKRVLPFTGIVIKLFMTFKEWKQSIDASIFRYSNILRAYYILNFIKYGIQPNSIVKLCVRNRKISLARLVLSQITHWNVLHSLVNTTLIRASYMKQNWHNIITFNAFTFTCHKYAYNIITVISLFVFHKWVFIYQFNIFVK